LPVLIWVTLCDAADFMAPRHTSLVAQASIASDKEMPVTKHDKTAGEGYKPGSPLYKKQEAREAAGKEAPPKPPASSAGGKSAPLFSLPSVDKDQVMEPSYWFQMRGGWKAHVRVGLIYFLQFFIIAMLLGCWYNRSRTRTGYAERPNSKDRAFAYDLFSTDHCLTSGGHHVNLCFMSWCCPCLRMADTWAKEPYPMMHTFWGALLLIVCLTALSQLTFGLTTCISFVLCLYFRQKLRHQYGLQSGGMTWLGDCCVWLWCPCCAIAQEARQVEFVQKPPDYNK